MGGGNAFMWVLNMKVCFSCVLSYIECLTNKQIMMSPFNPGFHLTHPLKNHKFVLSVFGRHPPTPVTHTSTEVKQIKAEELLKLPR